MSAPRHARSGITASRGFNWALREIVNTSGISPAPRLGGANLSTGIRIAFLMSVSLVTFLPVLADCAGDSDTGAVPRLA
jgi:hypothetical protein